MGYDNPYQPIPSQRYRTNSGGEYGAQDATKIGKVPLRATSLGRIPLSPNSSYSGGILGQLDGSFDDPSNPGYIAPPPEPTYASPSPTFSFDDGDSAAGSSSGGVGGTLAKVAETGLSLIPGIGAAAGLVGGILSGVFGGDESKRVEDPITTEALKRLTSARDSITNVNPEANRRMTDQSLSMQQGAAVQNALNTSQSQLANQGVGGDIVAPNVSAIANSTAAIGAAGQFTGARAQNNMHAIEMEQQRARDLNQNAADYGAQAAHVNLLHKQKQNFGSTLGNALLGGIAGAGTGGGILGQLGQVVTDTKTNVKR